MKFGMFLASVDFDGSKTPVQIFDELIEQAVQAEELGFDYVWLPEHVLVRYITSTDILQLAVLIAAKTKRIRIGGAVFVAPFYHPLGLAGRIAQADVLTRGRFEPGIGRGGSAYERRQFQVYKSEEVSREYFKEFVEIIRTGWESDHSIAFHGTHFDFNNSFVIPRPYSTPYPRIWLAATSTGSVTWAAEQGHDVLFTPFRRPFSAVVEACNAFREAGGGQQTPFGATEIAVNRTTYIASTSAKADEILPIIRLHDFVNTASRTDAERVVDGFRQWDDSVTVTNTDAEYHESLLIGTPEKVIDQIGQYQQAGVDQFLMWSAQGQPQEMVLESNALFAEHVFPLFQGDTPQR